MDSSPIRPQPAEMTFTATVDPFEDFLTPEQRYDAITDILATIALRALKQDHEDSETYHL
ncbi:MAG: hypothetical protein JO316_18930 [Abitibacteriaceae bacterium]|nr:hypothetical protein [Abditibacteriaceae bacterium]